MELREAGRGGRGLRDLQVSGASVWGKRLGCDEVAERVCAGWVV